MTPEQTLHAIVNLYVDIEYDLLEENERKTVDLLVKANLLKITKPYSNIQKVDAN